MYLYVLMNPSVNCITGQCQTQVRRVEPVFLPLTIFGFSFLVGLVVSLPNVIKAVCSYFYFYFSCRQPYNSPTQEPFVFPIYGSVFLIQVTTNTKILACMWTKVKLEYIQKGTGQFQAPICLFGHGSHGGDQWVYLFIRPKDCRSNNIGRNQLDYKV